MTLEAKDRLDAPYDMVQDACLILVLADAGALRESTVSLPGGCAIGDRPIDLHLKALERMGAESSYRRLVWKATAPSSACPAAISASRWFRSEPPKTH
jgi:UDP-N-acetylglucosamine 1-carboxyvinyltransferase